MGREEALHDALAMIGSVPPRSLVLCLYPVCHPRSAPGSPWNSPPCEGGRAFSSAFNITSCYSSQFLRLESSLDGTSTESLWASSLQLPFPRCPSPQDQVLCAIDEIPAIPQTMSFNTNVGVVVLLLKW